jgi:hypothetical protein
VGLSRHPGNVSLSSRGRNETIGVDRDCRLGLLLLGLIGELPAAESPRVIELNPASGGLAFEGIGGVSAGGKVPFSANAWHNLKFAFFDYTISAVIDGTQVTRIDNKNFDHGNCGIGSGWHGAQFANIVIRQQPPAERRL